ncbi:Retrotrans gag domain-containing protein [Abeliophyllum distichum]|uniref:Retrotrans gag domain-containing protein n=1 Tax=Abeliophyllum distichum TaxID=126358 RepID=A0ABD1RE63_9LAMI
MTRGGRTRRLSNSLPQTQNAPNEGDSREASRADELIHQTTQNPGHRNDAANDPHADRLAETLEALLQRQQNVDRFSIELAKRLGAGAFNGKGDPLDADNWMTQLERVFDVMECPEEKKLRLATFLLVEAAYDWWLTV